MKVLMINTVPLAKNGISTFIINNAINLAQQNVEVSVLASNKIEKNLKNKLISNNIKIIEILNRNNNPIKYFLKLRGIISKEKYDVVHVNGNSTTMAIELFAARLANTKIRIAHSHNTTTEHPFINKLLRPLFEFSVNTRIACNNAAGKWLFRDKKYTVIKNGIDLKKYRFNELERKKIRLKLNLSDEDVVLGNVGEFNYQKNQKFLIDLISKLDSKYKLLLIGNGNNMTSLKNLSQALNVQNRVDFIGVVDNVQDYLSAIDVFLLPSKFEGQPFVLVEASAAGLPCLVSSNVSKQNNLTDNMKFISINNSNLWKTAIKVESKRSEMSKKYRTILLQKGYDSNKNVNSLIKLYEGK